MAGYPGNKQDWEIPSGHSTIVDYFLGGGGFSRAALRTNPRAIVVAAESNPMMASLHMLDTAHRKLVAAHACESLATLKLFIHKHWDGIGTYSELHAEHAENMNWAWHHLAAQPFNAAMSTGLVPVASMAAQLLVSTLGFGTNVRTSSKGLNVPPNAQKIRSTRRIIPFAPIANIQSIAPSADMVQWDFEAGNTIALIDPPYVVPRHTRKTHQLLTSCYPEHDPYGERTWNLYWDTIASAMRCRSKTIIIANYFSVEMDAGVSALARSWGYKIAARVNHGELTTQNMAHRKKHGGRSQASDKIRHCDFEWRLVRQGNRSLHGEQKCLFFL